MTNRNDLSRAPTTRGYDNNKILIALVLGLVAVVILWYGVNNYVLQPAPAVHASAPATVPGIAKTPVTSTGPAAPAPSSTTPAR
jgi:hypothetical protein